jgi:predicted alpha/beta hydrolase
MLSVSFYSAATEPLVNITEIVSPKVLPVKLSANDEFILSADYYAGDNRSGGVLVLHDCENKRGAYSVVADKLAEQGLHILLVDLRGYGESVSQTYSRIKAKNKAVDIVSFQGEMARITAHWSKDLMVAYQFLVKKIDKSKGISVVSSGCSAAYTVALAENVQLNSMVMITPQMTYGDKERYKNLIDIPVYFITSVNHLDSYETADELFTWNGEKHSKMEIFKGTSHNYQLIHRKKYLANAIAIWVKDNLN